MFLSLSLIAQEFECDGSFYMVIYTESVGNSILYKIDEAGSDFKYEKIELSEARRLTGLNYNVNDKFLYALDVNSFEIVKIESTGKLTSLGIPENIDQTLIYSGATFSAEAGMIFTAYDPAFEKDTKIYSLDFDRFYAGFLGVTGAHPVKAMDFATDPYTGVIYGFDQLRTTLIQSSVSGGMTSLNYPPSGVSDIDALFFNQAGKLFAYSPSMGMYAIDKGSGEFTRLRKVPEGTSADGCSCPFTYTFEKTITPREIVPCQEFTVEYSFANRMAIGQIIDEFRDTFPVGFEVVDIKTNLISTFTKIIPDDSNIVALDLFIYLVGDNKIEVTMRAPDSYVGEFGSNAHQLDFPLAYGVRMVSDDPLTDIELDPSVAKVISEQEIDFTNYVTYSCDGNTAMINSPIDSETYEWGNGSTEESISTQETGWYSLRANNDCINYYDSVEIKSFPGLKDFDLGDDLELVFGDSVYVNLGEDFSNASVEWYYDNALIDCDNCEGIWIKPEDTGTLHANIVDDQGCEYTDQLNVSLLIKREVFQANVFTPNDDGINDYFFIQTAGVAEIKNMSVYNRWGNLVFEKSNFPSNDESQGWNGMVNETSLNNSVFVYVVDILYPDGMEDRLSGEVLMIAN